MIKILCVPCVNVQREKGLERILHSALKGKRGDWKY